MREKPERGGGSSPKGSKTVITGGHVWIKSAATPAPNTQAGLGLTVLLRSLKDHLFPSQQDPEGCWMLFFKGELHKVSPCGGAGWGQEYLWALCHPDSSALLPGRGNQ